MIMTDLKPPIKFAHRLSVAPMLDWTNRDFRYFVRLISQECLLYTEMVTTGALINGDKARFLGHDLSEQPIAFQLGGSDPKDLSLCARMAEDAGFSEVNLNDIETIFTKNYLLQAECYFIKRKSKYSINDFILFSGFGLSSLYLDKYKLSKKNFNKSTREDLEKIYKLIK